MNWILTVVFLIVIFSHYYLLGNSVLKFGKYDDTVSKSLILGFLFTYLISFIVAFPCQILHLNWNVFFFSLLFAYTVIDGLLILFVQKDHLMHIRNNLKALNRKQVICFFKNNWVGFVFVIVFTVLSISNQLPYYHLNYDDHYYIGKVMQLAGSEQMMTENFFNGAPEINTSLDLTRMLNTFESTYGFFANLFHIYIPFFCRVSMGVHNYIFMYLVYSELASLFVKKEYKQYAIAPFFVCIIPNGYLTHAFPLPFKIFSYDLWQFQTAVFYGGSVVRMLSIPILFLFSYPMLDKMELKKILVMAGVSISFISFSTIFIQDFLLFILIIILVKFIYMIYKFYRDKNKKLCLKYVFYMLLLIFLLCSTKLFDNMAFFDKMAYSECIASYIPFFEQMSQLDFFMRFGWIFIILAFVLFKEIKGRMFLVFLFLFYSLFKGTFFLQLLSLTSFHVFFVITRTFASVQYLIFFVIGILILIIIDKFKSPLLKINVLTIVSVCLFCGLFTYLIPHRNDFATLSSGVSAYGWDFSRVLNFSETMVPEVCYDVGKCFDTLEYDNYRLYTSDLVYSGNTSEEENKFVDGAGFVMVSNRIHTHCREGIPELNSEDFSILNTYCENGNSDINAVIELLKKGKIEYVLVQNEKAKTELIQQGFEMVLENNSDIDSYYLFKVDLK